MRGRVARINITTHVMLRIISVTLALLVAMSVFAKDGPNRRAKPMFIATTGRIIAVDARARTMMVSGSGGPAILQLKSTVSSSLDQFTLVTTSDTLFQDGADPIRFEDFKTGQTISIHGQLKGTILTASRVAKWD
jgi:hypothetical protein